MENKNFGKFTTIKKKYGEVWGQETVTEIGHVPFYDHMRREGASDWKYFLVVMPSGYIIVIYDDYSWAQAFKNCFIIGVNEIGGANMVNPPRPYWDFEKAEIVLPPKEEVKDEKGN